jgi:hypothetical protein
MRLLPSITAIVPASIATAWGGDHLLFVMQPLFPV